MKRYHGPLPVASNVQTRHPTHTTDYLPPPAPDFVHSQCGQTFCPFTFAPQFTSSNAFPSLTPIADNFPNRSPSATPPPLLSSARRWSLPSPTRSSDHKRRSLTPPDGRKSSSFSSQGATFVQSSSRLDSLIDGASHNLRQRLYSSPQSCNTLHLIEQVIQPSRSSFH